MKKLLRLSHGKFKEKLIYYAKKIVVNVILITGEYTKQNMWKM
jgi:hypothetical protein